MNGKEEKQPENVPGIEEYMEVLMAAYEPAAHDGEMDKEVSTMELANSIREHTGSDVNLNEINQYMKANHFARKASGDFGITWMMKRK